MSKVEDNPADIVSRGVMPSELPACDMWWHVPQFLYSSKIDFDANIDNHGIVNSEDNILEFKNDETTFVTIHL